MYACKQCETEFNTSRLDLISAQNCSVCYNKIGSEITRNCIVKSDALKTIRALRNTFSQQNSFKGIISDIDIESSLKASNFKNNETSERSFQHRTISFPFSIFKASSESKIKQFSVAPSKSGENNLFLERNTGEGIPVVDVNIKFSETLCTETFNDKKYIDDYGISTKSECTTGFFSPEDAISKETIPIPAILDFTKEETSQNHKNNNASKIDQETEPKLQIESSIIGSKSLSHMEPETASKFKNEDSVDQHNSRPLMERETSKFNNWHSGGNSVFSMEQTATKLKNENISDSLKSMSALGYDYSFQNENELILPREETVGSWKSNPGIQAEPEEFQYVRIIESSSSENSPENSCSSDSEYEASKFPDFPSNFNLGKFQYCDSYLSYISFEEIGKTDKGKKPYRCRECSIYFFSKSRFRAHEKLHIGEDIDVHYSGKPIETYTKI